MTDVPTYVTRNSAAQELDMSPDTFDEYVRKGILPGPKRRGKLTRWKWSEIEAVLDGGTLSVIQSDPDDKLRLGIKRAKEAHG